MSSVLQMNLPWVTIRSKLVQEDSEGILYETMFKGYTLNNSRIQIVCNLKRISIVLILSFYFSLILK